MKRTTEHVTVHEAKTHLSKLLRKVSRGQTIIITDGNRPIARLIPISTSIEKRTFGTEKGLVQIRDDFDLLPEEYLRPFKKG